MDSLFTRELYKAVISISVLAPFAGNIIGFIFLWINADKYGDFDSWAFWVVWPLYIAYDIGQMLLQFLFLPKIYDWVESAPLNTA